MITFKEIKWKNFLSTGKNFTSIDLAKNRSNLIVGSNGKGKSTLLDAITFVLFNKPFRKINLPQLVNTINGADCVVELTFTTNNNDYKIVRGIKPKVFEIYENNSMLQQSAAVDYQEYLENHILKMNYKAFTQIVVIGNATYMPFMKLSPADRRTIVESFLDIDIFTKMNGLLKTKIIEIKEKINDTNYKFELSKEKITMLQNILCNTEDNIEGKIEVNNNLIQQKEKELHDKNRKITKLNSEISSIMFNQEEAIKLSSKLNKLSTYINTFNTKQKALNKDITFLESNDSCPTCTQLIDVEFKSTKLLEKKDNLSKLLEATSNANNELIAVQSKLNELLSNDEQIKNRKAAIEKIEIELNFIDREIKKIQEDNTTLLAEKKQNLDKNKAEYEVLLKENIELSQFRDNLINDQHINSIASILLKDDGIKTKIIKYYLPTMNKLINKYLHSLDFYVNYNLNENFEEVIVNPAKESFTYNSFSEGEKLRIDLAILFAWREIAKAKNSANTNLLIMDEIFDSSLDGAGVDDFMKILETIVDDTNIFVISHKGDILFDKFSNIIRVDKVNGFSRIV